VAAKAAEPIEDSTGSGAELVGSCMVFHESTLSHKAGSGEWGNHLPGCGDIESAGYASFPEKPTDCVVLDLRVRLRAGSGRAEMSSTPHRSTHMRVEDRGLPLMPLLSHADLPKSIARGGVAGCERQKGAGCG
jgi:hypothetical protein